MSTPRLVVTFDLDDAAHRIVAAEVDGKAEVVSLPRLDDADRREALSDAQVLLGLNTNTELRAGELALLRNLRFVQFLTAGVDFIRLSDFPTTVPIACNGGAYAEPMAEHALAMILAAAKRLMPEHAALTNGVFNQFTPNRMLANGVCGILGFGGVGLEIARLARCLGMRVHAIKRDPQPSELADWIGTPADVDEMLASVDVLVISLPLTRSTRQLVGKRELEMMKSDAILVNLARGEIIDEQALYEHLVTTPTFTACLDVWWVEPVRHGAFSMSHPFTQLPNVIGSPHNSASVEGWSDVALRRAARNCLRSLDGLQPLHLIGDDERFG